VRVISGVEQRVRRRDEGDIEPGGGEHGDSAVEWHHPGDGLGRGRDGRDCRAVLAPGMPPSHADVGLASLGGGASEGACADTAAAAVDRVL
jgi:hypothetical protein